mgnify:CR=1 FL=1
MKKKKIAVLVVGLVTIALLLVGIYFLFPQKKAEKA